MELFKDDYELLFIKYEDFINDSRKSIVQVTRFLKVDFDEKQVDRFCEQLSPQESENIQSHKRSGRSGQYLDRLQVDTINYLDSNMKTIIDFYGF